MLGNPPCQILQSCRTSQTCLTCPTRPLIRKQRESSPIPMGEGKGVRVGHRHLSLTMPGLHPGGPWWIPGIV